MTVVVTMNNHNSQLSAVDDAVGTTCKAITKIRVDILYTAHVRSEQSLSNYLMEYSKHGYFGKETHSLLYYMVKVSIIG